MNIYDFYITPQEYDRAEINGISKRCIEDRIRKFGWNKEKAITLKVRKNENRLEWLKIALENGIKKGTFYARINTRKWDVERAANEPIVKKPNKGKFKYGEEVRENLIKNKISMPAFCVRLSRGWDVEKASTQKTLTREEVVEKMLKDNKTNGNYFSKYNRMFCKNAIR